MGVKNGTNKRFEQGNQRLIWKRWESVKPTVEKLQGKYGESERDNKKVEWMSTYDLNQIIIEHDKNNGAIK